MAKVIIKTPRLSSNPNTKLVKHEQGVNGMVNTTTNGKLFFVVDCILLDGMNPVKKSTTIWADDDGKFAISATDYAVMFGDSVTEGELVTFDDVPEYAVENSKGETKKYTYVRLLVLQGEQPAKVVSAWITRNANAASAAATAKTAAEAEAAGELATSKIGAIEAVAP